jgi:hypothetical protein
MEAKTVNAEPGENAEKRKQKIKILILLSGLCGFAFK